MDFISSDIHKHVCRVYMLGSNDLDQPWTLPLEPPL